MRLPLPSKGTRMPEDKTALEALRQDIDERERLIAEEQWRIIKLRDEGADATAVAQHLDSLKEMQAQIREQLATVHSTRRV